ncbi:MAG: cell wall hydrolase [Suilimivivens sp.]
MYKKFITWLFLGNMLFLAGWFCVTGAEANKMAASPAFQASLMDDQEEPRKESFFGLLKKVSSGQRVVDYEVLQRDDSNQLSEEDYEILLKIVQAEAGNEDEKGKMLVAGVVLNRVESSKFPDTVKAVVFQNENGVYQFSPVANGSYDTVKVSEETKEAVDRVLAGEDLTEGALYFAARKYADDEKMKWFDSSLIRLFEYGGHEFFTSG